MMDQPEQPAPQSFASVNKGAEYNLSSFSRLLKAACEDSLATDSLFVESLNMTFYMKQLNSNRADHWQQALQLKNEQRTGSPSQLLVALSLVDASGNWMFPPNAYAEHAILGEIPSDIRDELAERCLKLSKLGSN